MSTEENILAKIDENPNTSCRNVSAQIAISKSSVHRVLKEQLLHPFHIQKVHAMSAADFPSRLDFCNWLLGELRQNPNFTSKILFTDEAGFRRDGVINSHNLHHWADENPRQIIFNRNQQQFQVNVWAGLIGTHLVGPFILPPRLNGIQYAQFLRNHLSALMEEIPLDTRAGMWYMHDGAPPHFSLPAREVLNEKFQNRWIGRGGSVTWPARSPDLNPMDYYFWGHLKSLVYSTPINTVEQLIDRIFVHAGDLRNDIQTLFRVQRSMSNRAAKCIRVNGAHIEQLD